MSENDPNRRQRICCTDWNIIRYADLYVLDYTNHPVWHGWVDFSGKKHLVANGEPNDTGICPQIPIHGCVDKGQEFAFVMNGIGKTIMEVVKRLGLTWVLEDKSLSYFPMGQRYGALLKVNHRDDTQLCLVTFDLGLSRLSCDLNDDIDAIAAENEFTYESYFHASRGASLIAYNEEKARRFQRQALIRLGQRKHLDFEDLLERESMSRDSEGRSTINLCREMDELQVDSDASDPLDLSWGLLPVQLKKVYPV